MNEPRTSRATMRGLQDPRDDSSSDESMKTNLYNNKNEEKFDSKKFSHQRIQEASILVARNIPLNS